LENDFEIPTYSHWEKLVEHELNGKNFNDHLITDSYEGIKIKPLYTKSNIGKIQYLNNMPGFENYLRGNSASGNVTNGWEIKQLLKTTNLKEFNKQLRKALKNGQNSITIPIDLSV
jgi:methylmalonyl-CoA mutase